MVSITFSLEDRLFSALGHFPWVNWSKVAREKILKKEIFETYIKTGAISDEDWEFCESIDWHPVDELPLREKFAKRLKEARKETPHRFNSVDEFFETIK